MKMEIDDDASSNDADDTYNLSSFMRDYVFKNPFDQNIKGNDIDEEKAQTNDDNSSNESNPQLTNDTDNSLVDYKWKNVVDTPKAHYGSNIHFCQLYKFQNIQPKYRKVKRWLEKNYKYSAEFPKMRTHHSIIMRDIKQLFPYITNRVLSRILSITFRDCKKVISKSEGMYYTSLVKKPSEPIFSDPRVKTAMLAVKNNGVRAEEAAMKNCIQIDLLKRVLVWTNLNEFHFDDKEVQVVDIAKNNELNLLKDIDDSKVFCDINDNELKIKIECESNECDYSKCHLSDEVNPLDLKKYDGDPTSSESKNYETIDNSIFEIKPEEKDIFSSAPNSDDSNESNAFHEMLEIDNQITIDIESKNQSNYHIQAAEVDLSLVKIEEEESSFNKDRNVVSSKLTNAENTPNMRHNELLDYTAGLENKIICLQNELIQCKTELSSKESINDNLVTELNKSNSFILYLKNTISERDNKLKLLSCSFKDIQCNLSSIQKVFEDPQSTVSDYQNQ